MPTNEVGGASQAEPPFGELPTLKRFGGAGARPVIVIDQQEKAPLVFERLESRTDHLTVGDYSVDGLSSFCVERKSVEDLANCVGQDRDRFLRQIDKMQARAFRRLLVVGTEVSIARREFHSLVTPQAIMATLAMIEARFLTPVVFCPCPRSAARRIELWAFYWTREAIPTANYLIKSVRDHELNKITNGEEAPHD